MTTSTAPAATGTRFLARPGGRIAYDLAGDGPLVVAIPGMGDLRSSWRHQVPALVAAGYRVATLDLRGHGDSDTTFDAYDDVAAATDALALIAELGGGPAVILGNSMGAGAAVWAAAETPGAVAGVVLVGPFVRNPPASALQTAMFKLLLMKPWGPAALAGWFGKLHAGTKPADLEAHRAEVKAALARPGHWAAFKRTAGTSHAPAEARLGEVRAPALIVMGDQDPDFKDPAAEATWIAERLGGEIVMVPATGHYPQSQRPDLVNAALLPFLGRVTGRA
jgi:pimeloyl-ACP methyl ester carboxylesterase